MLGHLFQERNCGICVDTHCFLDTVPQLITAEIGWLVFWHKVQKGHTAPEKGKKQKTVRSEWEFTSRFRLKIIKRTIKVKKKIKIKKKKMS